MWSPSPGETQRFSCDGETRIEPNLLVFGYVPFSTPLVRIDRGSGLSATDLSRDQPTAAELFNPPTQPAEDQDRFD